MKRTISLPSKKYLPFALLIAIQLFFLISTLRKQHTSTADSKEYLLQAQNLMQHGSTYCGDFEDPVKDPGLYSRRTPGYAVFILITSWFLFLPSLTLLAQVALSLFNSYIGFKIADIVSKGSLRKGLYYAAFLFFPSQFIYAATFMSEIPFQTSLVLAVYFLFLFHERGQRRNLYFSHLFVAIAYLIKPIAVFLWVFFILFSTINKTESRSSQHMALLALAHFVLIGTILMTNYHKTGLAEYSGIGRKVIFNYTLPAVLRYSYGEEKANHLIDSVQNELGEMPYALQSTNTESYIRHVLLTRPVDFVRVQLLSMPKFFLETCRWDLEFWREGIRPMEKTPSLVNAYKSDGINGILNIFCQWPVVYTGYYSLVTLSVFLLFFAFIKGLFSKVLPRRYKLFFGILILYFVLLTGPSASARFRLPVFPFIALLAVSAFSEKKEENPGDGH